MPVLRRLKARGGTLQGKTAFKATFVTDHARSVKFRQESKTDGDRAEVEQVLAALRGS